jgi:transposase
LHGDINDQKAWVSEFEQLQKVLPNNEKILFLDAVHPTHNSTFAKTWYRDSAPKTLPTNSGRKRINIQGSYDVNEQNGVFTKHDTVNSDAIIEHYERLIQQYPGIKVLHLVQDNARYYHSEKVRDWIISNNKIAGNPQIKQRFLPTYSPNLNKIEKLWLFMSTKIFYNKYYEKFTDFKKAIDDFTENIDIYRDELATFITLKFHIPESKSTSIFLM